MNKMPNNDAYRTINALNGCIYWVAVLDISVLSGLGSVAPGFEFAGVLEEASLVIWPNTSISLDSTHVFYYFSIQIHRSE